MKLLTVVLLALCACTPESQQGVPTTSPTLRPSASASATRSPIPSPTPSTARRPDTFTAHISILGAPQRTRMIDTGAWRAGCPVSLSNLRAISVSYWTFSGTIAQGTLVMNEDVASATVRAMRAIFNGHFPIRRMQPVEYYGADDERSMTADNTSGYNCRGVSGSAAWSQHAFGRAIDLDPLENPEVRNGIVDPPAGARFANRNQTVMGMIHEDDVAVRAFDSIGWGWGGRWHSLKDYQHFSKTGT